MSIAIRDVHQVWSANKPSVRGMSVSIDQAEVMTIDSDAGRLPAIGWIARHPGVAVALLPLLYSLVKVVRVSHFTRSSQLALLRESDALTILAGTVVPLVPTTLLIALAVALESTVRSTTIGTRLRVTASGLLLALVTFLLLALPLNRLLPTIAVIVAFGVLVALVIPDESRTVKVIAVAVLATGIQVVAVDEMWVPTEATIIEGGESSVGYVLSDDGKSVVWLRDDSRTIVRIDRDTITDQWFCRLRPASRSIIELVQDRDPRAEVPACP